MARVRRRARARVGVGVRVGAWLGLEEGGDAAASLAAVDGERVHVPGVVPERLVGVRVRVGSGG